jgi:purine-binding chemotaxis protein CheW
MSAMIKTARQEVKTAEEMDKYLCFLLNNKSYAINISRVKEIMEHTEITPIPMMPEFFRGAINLRGSVVPVIDISNRLGMGASQISKRTCIVIIEVETDDEHLDVGVMVDAVSEVADIPSEHIEQAPSFGGRLETEFMHGMGKLNDNFVILLNVDRILSMEDVEMLKEIGDLSVTEPDAQDSDC